MESASPLGRLLLARVSAATRTRLSAIEDLEDLVTALVARGRAAWPDVELSDVDFVEHLANKLGDCTDPGSALRRVRAEDLFLACACGRGDPRALACFEATYMKSLEVRPRRNSGAALVDDVRQAVRERLLLATPSRAPRILDYAGHGDLGSWLRVVALRVALNLVRAEHPREDLDSSVALPATEQAEIEIFKRMYREDFRAAFADAMVGLTARERNILRHHYIDGLSMDRIAVMYAVHRNTVLRWIDAARRTLGEETRTALAARLGVEAKELDSVMRLIRSQLEVSVRLFLTERSSS